MKLPKTVPICGATFAVVRAELDGIEETYNLTYRTITIDSSIIVDEHVFEVYRHEVGECAAAMMGCKYSSREDVFVFNHEQFTNWTQITNAAMVAVLERKKK